MPDVCVFDLHGVSESFQIAPERASVELHVGRDAKKVWNLHWIDPLWKPRVY